jgi:hypothetical protein
MVVRTLLQIMILHPLVQNYNGISCDLRRPVCTQNITILLKYKKLEMKPEQNYETAGKKSPNWDMP